MIIIVYITKVNWTTKPDIVWFLLRLLIDVYDQSKLVIGIEFPCNDNEIKDKIIIHSTIEGI